LYSILPVYHHSSGASEVVLVVEYVVELCACNTAVLDLVFPSGSRLQIYSGVDRTGVGTRGQERKVKEKERKVGK